MKIFQKTLLIAAAALAFAACSEDFDAVVDSNQRDDLQPVGEKVTLTLGLSVDDMEVAQASPEASSRAEVEESLSVSMDGLTRVEGDEESDPTVAATAAESAIKNLWVLQFSGTSAGATLQVCNYYDSSKISDNTVSVDLYDANGAPTTTYFIANVGADAFKTLSGTLSKFQDMSFDVPEGGFGGAYLTNNGLPMMAKYDLTAATGEQKIKLERMCAKVVLTLKQDAGFTDFTADSDVNLCSTAEKFFYHDNENNLTAVNANFRELLVPRSVNVSNLTSASGVTVTFYVPENLRGDGTSTTKQSKNWWNAPAHSSYLEVTGTYTNPSASATATKIAYRIFPGADDSKNYDIKRNTCYNITATIKGANANGDGRVTSAENVNLSENGTANCYISRRAGQVYEFDASVNGNGATTPAFSKTQGALTQNAEGFGKVDLAPVKVALLWETGEYEHCIIKNIKLDVENKKVYFSTSGMIGMPANEGNALLAVYDKDNNIAWSWHIWSTDYDPTTSAVTHVGGSNSYQLMDRNLGAFANEPDDPASYGLLYQWGRKDPFVGSGTNVVGEQMKVLETVDQAQAGTTWAARLEYAAKNPTTFMCQRDTKCYDWLGINDWSTQADNLWGNPNDLATINKTSYNTHKGAKSVYDPCPVGWMVPPQDTWIQFIKNVTWTNQYGSTTVADFNVNGGWSAGWNFYTNYAQTIQAYYPAAGYRYRESGALTGVGSNGYYWSSSSYAAGNINAGSLSFLSGNVYPLNGNCRAYGFSVR
ncbi:MAG: DUF4906 domain-containing protein, partial [Alistipes sp.]|nr:DUF4906 domain-containing protein [Alistipes sp.]